MTGVPQFTYIVPLHNLLSAVTMTSWVGNSTLNEAPIARTTSMSKDVADAASLGVRSEGNPESLCRCVPCGECFYTPKEATDHFESAQHLREMQARQAIFASQPSSALNRFMRREPRIVRPLTVEEKLLHSKLLQPLLMCNVGESFGDFVRRHGLFTTA
ncbi:hypothetical protein BIW11_13548 [Tropilaelaps mercedesae]|uniref:C2H2-type domain-containing protein n=1 Tax=Tropilaelaps mercedesae TaxID=418985 RepID=A0A1V9X1Y8_9ACAR|nr:hypothetical protein BIW11_13548 [Tropilaelaps mercedesae]